MYSGLSIIRSKDCLEGELFNFSKYHYAALTWPSITLMSHECPDGLETWTRAKTMIIRRTLGCESIMNFDIIIFGYLTFKYFLRFMVFWLFVWMHLIRMSLLAGTKLIYSKQSLSMYLLEYTRDGSINTKILSNTILSK